MADERPVLIGAGQFTYRGKPEDSPDPVSLLKIAAERASQNAGLPVSRLAGIDALAVAGFSIDATPGARGIPRSSNPPMSLARALGAKPAWSVYSEAGGNTSQYMVNVVAEKIARGEASFALVIGAEFLGSATKRLQKDLGFAGWEGDEDLPPPERIGDPRPGVSPYEARHAINRPINIYPMFENALRARDGRSIEAHQQHLGRLFAPFTKVAAQNPEAWFPIERSPEELITVSERNRMIGFPYPKYLNAIMEVDQSAGVIMCSESKARELGVPEERWVYLHGCADAADLWFVTERQNFHSSPAMRWTGKRALEMAGIGTDDLKHIDLYSCFPSAVQVGAEELGLSLDDPRGFTVTGGLPYMGGPGNNYAMHAIVTMADRLRADRGAYGLCTANGWYLTKQSVGVYSTRRPERPFEREDPKVLQAQIDALPHPEVTETPSGRGTIETYTVIHSRDGYYVGIVVGRDEAGRRFVANTPLDSELLASMEKTEQIGRQGTVTQDAGKNIFTPE